MVFHEKGNTSQGFSLIELLVVIVIISLLLATGMSGFKTKKSRPKALTPLNLKETIMKSEFFAGRATLMCVDHAKKCYLRKSLKSAFEPYQNKINLHDIKAYSIDKTDTLVEIEYERFHDEKISLVIDFYNNGSSTQIILEDRNGAYFLPAFFGEAKAFDSIEDAQKHWLKNSRLVANSGEYY